MIRSGVGLDSAILAQISEAPFDLLHAGGRDEGISTSKEQVDGYGIL